MSQTSGPAPEPPTTPPRADSGGVLGGAPPEPVVRTPVLELREPLPPVIDDPDDLDGLAKRLAAGSGPIAIDAERASGYRYSQRAYLIQIRRRGTGTLLIDPIPFGDVPNDSFSGLAAAAGDAEWVIHAASQDLPCLAELGLRPPVLFDTELAGRLLDFPRVGLAVLVESLLGFSMRKEHSAVDWSRRPLPEPWLLYAALDVELLLELRDALADRLDKAGRTDWAVQEFSRWAAQPTATRRRDPWRRTSGIHRVRGRRGLAVVRELWLARDEIAQRRDIAPSKIVRDPGLIEAALAVPDTREGLGSLPGFGHRVAERHQREFLGAIRRATSLTEAELPPLAAVHDGPPPARIWAAKFPQAAGRLGACRERVQSLADEIGLPQENLVDPDVVRQLAWEPPSPATVDAVAERMRAAGAREWQVGLTAEALSDALGDSG